MEGDSFPVKKGEETMQKKWRKKMAALLAFVLAGVIYCAEACREETPVWESGRASTVPETAQTGEKPEAAETSENGEEQSRAIYVHICGAVKKPGVYEVPESCRLYELLALAGGASEEGCADALNLAEVLRDGQRVVIPTRSEAEAVQSKPEQTDMDGRININTASAAELMTLPGIGEAKAADIIRYREEKGELQTIEEIMEISGIKDALFQKIKDRIKV